MPTHHGDKCLLCRFDQYYPNDKISYPPKTGWGIPKDVPVMAPHDWTGEGMRYGDLHDVTPGGVIGGRKTVFRAVLVLNDDYLPRQTPDQRGSES